jgi:uncharacterized protein (TIGR02453 family)
MSSFAGFPKEGLSFFAKLRKNNTREWFETKKETYIDKVKTPMEELVALVNAELAKFAPEHITEPKKAVYRIYRDTRFSNDKTPYKTHIAANFPRSGMEKHAAAGFYFSVSNDVIEIGGGVYMPGPAELAAIRGHIAENYAALQKIAATKKTIELMGDLQGDALRRVPRGFPEDHPAAALIRMKQWLFFKSFPADVAGTPELLPFVASRLKAAAPLVAYLNAPLIAMKKTPAAAFLKERA